MILTPNDLRRDDETSGPDSASGPSAADPVLLAAVDLARAVLVEAVEDAGSVGEHQGADPEPVAFGAALTHRFVAVLAGYRGWHWAVTVSRAEDTDHVTVSETVLLPGDGAVVVPEWLPWSERIRPGDLSPGDLVPTDPDDPRLAPAYLLSDDPAVEDVAMDLGLGRSRVMSRDGRLETAERWQSGPHGATSAMAKHAPGACGTCGFYLPLNGSLGAMFGACGNEMSPADGSVVVADHGCGAHSDATPMVPLDAEVGYHAAYESELLDLEQPEPPIKDVSETVAIVVEADPVAIVVDADAVATVMVAEPADSPAAEEATVVVHSDQTEVVVVDEPSVVEVTDTADAVVVEVHAAEPRD